jgi:uncharacterized membrane protein
MQVLLLPLLIIRMILSIIMSITTLSFLSRTDRRIQQAYVAGQPGQVQRPATNGMSSKTLVLVLAIVGVFMVAAFLANQAQLNAAPQPAQSTDAATAAPCQVTKHHKGHRHHRAHPGCSPTAGVETGQGAQP